MRSVPVRIASSLVAAALLLVVATGVLTPPPAGAATAEECDALIYGQADSVTDSAELRAAVGGATRAGALVRVRAYDRVPAGDLDAYVADLLTACPSWRAPDGTRRSNLLVMAVSTGDRTTGLYYGSAYDGPLASQWNRIQADLMNPRFRDGDFAIGLAAGLGEATRLIQEWQHPRAAPTTPAASDADATTTADAATNLIAIFLVVLVLLIVLGVVGGSVLLIVRVMRRRGRERQSADATRARVQSAYDRASAAFVTVDGNAHAAAEANAAVMASVSDEDDLDLTTAMSTAQAAVDAASRRWIEAQERWGTGALATVEGDQAKAAQATLGSVADDLIAADALITAATARALDLTASADSLPDQLQQARDATATATADLAKASEAGLDVTSRRQAMDAMAADLAQAAAMIDGHRVRAATTLIAQIRDRAQAVSVECAELPGSLERAAARLVEVAAAVAFHRSAQLRDAAVLDELTATYGPASVDDIQVPVTAMAGRLDEADAAVAEGHRAVGLRSLEGLDQAAACAAAAQAAVDAVTTAHAALEGRSAELPALATDLPTRLTALGEAVEQARGYVTAHANDVDPSRTDDLDAALAQAQALSDSLSAGHADLPRINGQLQVVETAVSTTAAAAADQVRTAEQERSRARAALAKAKADLDATEAALNRYGDGSGARGTLKVARSSFAQAEASADVALILSLSAQASAQAEQAERAARQAHDQARDQAQRQERDERDARESRDSGGGGGSSSFGSGGGGGGSSKW